MSKHLARDYSLWNKLKYGRGRVPSPEPDEAEFFSEKAETITSQSVPELLPEEKRRMKLLWRCFKTLFPLWMLFWFYMGTKLSLWLNGEHTVLSPPELSIGRFRGYVDDGVAGLSGAAPQEIITVAYPFVARDSGALVHSEVLVNHTFGEYGHPSVSKLRVPDAEFNRVVLTLRTTVAGVQYDRLAHLYVGGAEIWRTSTIEPGGRSVYSEFKKDVSSYVRLFAEPTHVVFQLDNVVLGRLTGKFHVELTAHYYNNERLHYREANLEDGADAASAKYRYFDSRRPADKVFPLVETDSPAKTPLRYLPGRLVLPLPRVARNTTRLLLAVFASGNADEEFWYTNVLDKYKDVFAKQGRSLLGHGPLRFVSVYVDGQKVGTQPPQPFIFTGGFSPALWSPVVATNAFDLPSVDFDVTALLPLLWDGRNHTVEIAVENAYDQVDGTSLGIGRDWIVSANLLAYEHAEVKHAAGRVLNITHHGEASEHSAAPPYTGTLVESTRGFFNAAVTSELVLELANGDTVNATVLNFAQSTEENVQLHTRGGSTVRYVHRGVGEKAFALYDNDEQAVMHEYKLEVQYPLVLTVSESSVEGGEDLDVSIVNTKLTALRIGDKLTRAESVVQTGRSEFHVRDTGNHGTGSLTTKYETQISGPTLRFKYKRLVVSKDGAIVEDREEYEDKAMLLED